MQVHPCTHECMHAYITSLFHFYIIYLELSECVEYDLRIMFWLIVYIYNDGCKYARARLIYSITFDKPSYLLCLEAQWRIYYLLAYVFSILIFSLSYLQCLVLVEK